MRAYAGIVGVAILSTMGPHAAAMAQEKPSPQARDEPPWLTEFRSGPKARTAARAVGRELFSREWTPGDPRAHGGDGLGPVFNATSCVACHHLGGAGGAGPKANNVQVAVAIVRPAKGERAEDVPIDGLIRQHPGFRVARSVVLHRDGVDPDFENWRQQFGGDFASKVSISVVERNTPALFGAGLIDAVPDDLLVARASMRHPGFPNVNGRARLDKTGRVARFGWKGQIGSLGEFVRTACAVEMGLEVPGHSQSLNPTTPDLPAPGLDLTDAECDALTLFVAGLPVPPRRQPLDRATADLDSGGEAVFERIGCATCHARSIGPASGIYSDLLLHDMGSNLGDLATYYGSPAAPIDAQPQLASGDPPASATEWRTPPLWGVGRSAPYLHDGRAATIDEAIRMHAGEAAESARHFASLSPVELKAIRSFINSLAPPSYASARTRASR